MMIIYLYQIGGRIQDFIFSKMIQKDKIMKRVVKGTLGLTGLLKDSQEQVQGSYIDAYMQIRKI